MSAFIPYAQPYLTSEVMYQKAQEFRAFMETRRSLRMFSDAPVLRSVIEQIIMTASTAPSGAHKQPWTFCAVQAPEIKKQIRIAAEQEEFENYHGRMSDRWLKDLEAFATDHHKPFLETAPWLIVVFKQSYGISEGEKMNNYYVSESVGIATGFLLAAIHNAGLVALTHTPSPMDFLARLLQRPQNEKPFLLIPVGYPATGAQVPDLQRKNLEDVSVFI